MPRLTWAILLVLTAILYLPGTGVLPLMDRDEPRFARATVEMLERSSWLVPYFNDNFRFDKPPLTYWWMRLHHWALGIDEFSSRLHSIFAVWLTALVIASLGKRLWNARAGLWAAIIWLTMLQVLVHGRLCVADMPMVLCVTLAMRAALELLLPPLLPPRRYGFWFWVLWISLGAGFLAKGPIALLVPALALLLWRLALWRRAAPWQSLQLRPGLLVMLALVAAWGIPALIATNGQFWSVGMGDHVAKRGLEVLNGRKFVPGFYFGSAFLSLFPWVGFLGVTWAFARRHWDSRISFLAAWFAAPFLIFSLYATQLPHYIMPGFPAAALLAAGAFVNAPHLLQKAPRLLRVLVAIFVVLALAALAFAFPLRDAEPAKVVLAGVWLLLAVALAGGLCHWLLRPGWRAAAAALAWCILLPASVIHLNLVIRAHHATLRAVSALGRPDPKTEYLGWEYTEPSLVYYTGHPWTWTPAIPGAVEKFFAQPGPRAVVLLRREWTLDYYLKTLVGAKPPGPARDRTPETDTILAALPGLEVTTISGFNAARSSWAELLILRRQ